MTTLASAAAVLRCFSATRSSVTVTEAASLPPGPKSNTCRLLRAKRHAGLLETMAASRRFRPGTLLLGLGRRYRTASSVIDRAGAAIARLVAALRHTGYLARRDGNTVSGVTCHPGSHARHGAPPVHSCAAGQAQLACKTDDQVRAVLAEPWTPASCTAPQGIAELLDRQRKVCALGCAESHDAADSGVATMARAVGAPEAGRTVSLCIAYPTASVTAVRGNGVFRRLLAGARDVAALVDEPVWARQAIDLAPTA